MQQHDLIDVFIAPLEGSRIEYMITGSVAATIYGEPRLTHDIDLVIALRAADIPKFSSLFPATDFYCPPQEVLRIETSRKTFAHFNLIHHDTGYKADMYPLTGEPLHAWGFENRRRIPLKAELQIWVAPPEYVIVRKLQYFKEGGSQKHLSDIRKIIDSPESTIDSTQLERWIVLKGVQKEWALAGGYEER
ncbi:MAG: hypothetical protein JXA18_10750 [Chitinispirillaceae bacterium]|nr:hypothetical protein [Chitinispirillaceae bacterium]